MCSIVAHKGDVVIAVMGPTGAGKSTFINAVTGRNEMIVGSSLRSCTQQIAAARCQIGTTWVTLIDTPGFDDTDTLDTDILERIAEFLTTTYYDGKLINGLILLQSISANRVTGSERRRTRLYEKICGPNAYAHIVIATTMWSELSSEAEGELRMEERKNDLEFWGSMVAQGTQVVRHDNTAYSARRIVQILMYKSPVILQMQQELQQNGGQLIATSAGQQLDADLVGRSEQLQKWINQLQYYQHTADEMQRLRDELAIVEAEVDRLRRKRSFCTIL